MDSEEQADNKLFHHKDPTSKVGGGDQAAFTKDQHADAAVETDCAQSDDVAPQNSHVAGDDQTVSLSKTSPDNPDQDNSSRSSSRKRKLNQQLRRNEGDKIGEIDNSASDDASAGNKVASPTTPRSDDDDANRGDNSATQTSGSGDQNTNSDNTSPTAGDTDGRPSQPPPVQQPEGWRVKLYRLNADGGWDDCGTGRIVCLYRNGNANSPPRGAVDSGSSNGNVNEGKSSPSTSSPPNRTVGSDAWLYHETGEATLCVHSELSAQNRHPRVLLRTRVLLRDAYQRQGDNIITWCEPYYNSGRHHRSGGGNNNNSTPLANNLGNSGNNSNSSGVDLALSFQDNAGCLNIWHQITHVQSRADELLRQHQPPPSAQDMAAQVASQHHADLEQQHYEEQQQHEMWTGPGGGSGPSMVHDADDVMHGRAGGGAGLAMGPTLPQPPTLDNLEEVADTIVAIQHVQHRENLVAHISKDDCVYLKELLALFPSAEEQGDYSKLATLAACVKTILLMNDPFTLDLIVSVPSVFEQVCSCLEYDPDLREKANHRWFLRERAKFRTVVPMEDPDLVSAIHRSFRVNYIRDTLLRPTMDEASLSTLSSLQTFTHAEVVKGVAIPDENQFALNNNSYLVRVIRMLGHELHAIGMMEWMEIESQVNESIPHVPPATIIDEFHTDDSIVVVGKHQSMDQTTTEPAATWKQYLAPQDSSIRSRKIRRRGCISFLRELFNMVRMSLQQRDKEDFFLAICGLDVDLLDDREIPDNVSQTSQTVEVGSVASTIRSDRLDDKTDTQSHEFPQPASPVTLLSLFGHVLSDPTSDVSEKTAVLEIISSVALHDPALIRRHVLVCHNGLHRDRQKLDSSGKATIARPDPNGRKQVLFLCPPSDLLASLLFLLDIETDAGLLLQATEIMRIILDSDVMNDHGPTNSFADEAEPPNGGLHGPPHDQHNQPSGVGATTTEQKQFLSLFYEHYVEWLVAPFQFSVLYPARRIPESTSMNPSESPLLTRMTTMFPKGVTSSCSLFKTAPNCAIRGSFAIELMSFCVRAHLYRMKFFLLKSRVLSSVLKSLKPRKNAQSSAGDRCLKLAALRLMRAILSVNDEFYNRHIIQQNLFVHIFEALRANPVGDNLVSSAIVEMCDYIHNENIYSLLDYIVTRHLTNNNNDAATDENSLPSLEQVSSPYVSTLTVMRKEYEAKNQPQQHQHQGLVKPKEPDTSSYRPRLCGKALEDQRRFCEMDEEEAYFESGDDEVATGQVISTVNSDDPLLEKSLAELDDGHDD